MPNNKTNIWIFNHYAVTPNLPGITRHFDFGKELVKRGYKVTIFAASFHHNLRKETKIYNKNTSFLIEDYEGVRFVWLKTFPYKKNDGRRILNMLSYSISAYKVAKKLEIEKPDVIIGSSIHLFGVFTSYLLAKKFKIPFIMEVRDLWPQTLIDMGVSKWHPFIILLGILEKFLYRRADKIIVLLPRANEYIERFGISREKIVWISNGVDLERFKMSKNVWDDKAVEPFFTITYAGSIGNANNLDTILEVAEILNKEYPSIKFQIIGDGPERERLIRLVREKNLKNIEFKGPVPKQEVAQIFHKSSALFLVDPPISNMHKYGRSINKLFDYMASGRPIIFFSNFLDHPVEEAKAGITVPLDHPQKMAEAIVRFCELPERERQRMGNNGRIFVEKFYSIPVLVDKLEDVVKSVISDFSSKADHVQRV